MKAWKKGFLCIGLLLSFSAAYAACDSKQSITVTVSDELNESQQSENLTVKFANGPSVAFNLTPSKPLQEHKVKLPLCDEYRYTINGTMKFLKNDPEWKGASLTLRGKQSIRLKDGDELAVWGDFSSNSVKTIDAMLGPKNMMDQAPQAVPAPDDDNNAQPAEPADQSCCEKL